MAMAGGAGGVGVSLDVNQLLTQLFGASTTVSGNTDTSGTQVTDATTNNTGTTTTKEDQTTTNSASDASLKALQGVIDSSTKNAADDSITTGIVSNIMHKAAIAFAPVVGNSNSSGVYNSSTLQNLADEASAAATGQAAQSVLDYKTQQNQITSNAAANLAGATKTSTSTGSTIQDVISSIVQNATATATGKTKSVTDNTQHSLFSVICTELTRQKKMSPRLYIASSRYIPLWWDWGVSGYHIWAVPIVQYMRKHPDSKVTSLINWLFHARAYAVIGKSHFVSGWTVAGVTWVASLFCRLFLVRKPIDVMTVLYSGKFGV